MATYFPNSSYLNWPTVVSGKEIHVVPFQAQELVEVQTTPTYIHSRRVGINVATSPDNNELSSSGPWLTVGGKVCIGSDLNVNLNAKTYDDDTPDLWVIGRIGVSYGDFLNNPFSV